MVQIIPAAQRKQNFGQKLSQGVGRGLDFASQLMQAKEAKQQALQDFELKSKAKEDELRLASQLRGDELKKEYDLKNILEEGKQQAKYKNKLDFMNSLGLGGQEISSEPIEEMPKGILSEEFGGAEPKSNKKASSKRKPKEKMEERPPHTSEEITAMSMVEPTVANNWQRQNEDFYRRQEHKEKSNVEKRKEERHEKEFFHSETKKFDENLTEQYTAAQKKNRAIEKQLQLAHKVGKWDRVVSALAGQSKWGDLLKSSTAQEFDSYALPQMEGLRQILGGVLSDSDIRLIMQKVVTSSKTPEANEKIAKYLMSENNYIIAKKQIADEIKRNNAGYRPPNYESEIERIFKERYGDQIRKEFEEIKNLPDDAKKLNQVGRRIVPPGTQLGENAIKMYYEMANGDPIKATELAEEDGYDVPK